MSFTRSEFSADLRAGEPSGEPAAYRKRRPFARFLITFCSGVAATLAWQSYGDSARETIASSYPQLSWLAPQVAVAQTAAAMIEPPITSLDRQELKTISLGLTAVSRKVDQLVASQQQIARDFATKLQAAEQGILEKISVPPPQPTPARKPVPSLAQPTPVR